MNIWFPIVIVGACGILMPALCEARFQRYCADCHTMHASQGRDDMVYATYTPTSPPIAWKRGSLLRNNCAGCHTGTNDGSNDIPYVMTTSGVEYGSTGTESNSNTIAGGNFYWLTQASGDPKAHNVVGLAGKDATPIVHTKPPGGSDSTYQLTCAGTYGCHGDRAVPDQVMSIHGAHHSASTAVTDGTTYIKSYRWLNGVAGYENTDYEYRPSASSHNQYKGEGRSSDINSGDTTMSHFCADCHGDFHWGAGTLGIDDDATAWGGPWVRHPTDYDLWSLTGEYDSFNKGIGVNTYSVTVPLASGTVTSPISTIAAGSAYIMCLSCHRAHGSKFDSILRWDYKSWPSSGYNGCAVCHTAKD